MKNSAITVVLFLLLLISNKTEAQSVSGWNLELRSNGSFPTTDISNTDLKPGIGFEGSVAYRFMPHLSAYAGWSWNHFSANESIIGTDSGFEETGYSFGLQFIHPIASTGIEYLLRAGGTYNHIEVENSDGDIISDSGHGFGWQAEIGLVINLNDHLNLLPSMRYRSLSRNLDINRTESTVDLNYISVGVGLSWSL